MLFRSLTGILTMLKGLPFAYNRDLQEDKEPFFDSIDTVLLTLPAITGMVATTTFDREKMKAAAPQGFSLATEIADFLVRAHVPFARAHEAAGKCVAQCEKEGKELHQLTDDQLTAIHPKLTKDVRSVLTVEGALKSRTSQGASSPTALAEQISLLQKESAAANSVIASKVRAFSEMMGQ